MYKHLVRPILFTFSPEAASGYLMSSIGLFSKIPGGRQILNFFYGRRVRKFIKKNPSLKTELFGLHFPSPIGVAAGLDKNGEHYNEFKALGFGFVEIGSLTVTEQEGRPKPRLFRLSADRALINRLGVNNKGVMNAISHFQKDIPGCIISANITHQYTSKTLPDIATDYRLAFELLYDFVDFFTLNLSYPVVNDSEYIDLQSVESLEAILDPILDLRLCYESKRPILVKISPDIAEEELDSLLDWCMSSGIDGIVACNTTSSREFVSEDSETLQKIGKGGLSGAPLFAKSLEVIKHINQYTRGKLPIIGAGGVMSAEDARKMLDAGASLIEAHTGIIYEGFSFARNIIKGLSKS